MSERVAEVLCFTEMYFSTVSRSAARSSLTELSLMPIRNSLLLLNLDENLIRGMQPLCLFVQIYFYFLTNRVTVDFLIY